MVLTRLIIFLLYDLFYLIRDLYLPEETERHNNNKKQINFGKFENFLIFFKFFVFIR